MSRRAGADAPLAVALFILTKESSLKCGSGQILVQSHLYKGKLLFLVKASKVMGDYYPLDDFQYSEALNRDNKLTE